MLSGKLHDPLLPARLRFEDVEAFSLGGRRIKLKTSFNVLDRRSFTLFL
jgi:hypothetical protein